MFSREGITLKRVAPTSLRLNPTYIQVRDALQRWLNPNEGGTCPIWKVNM
jgi:hypothetical protein